MVIYNIYFLFGQRNFSRVRGWRAEDNFGFRIADFEFEGLTIVDCGLGIETRVSGVRRRAVEGVENVEIVKAVEDVEGNASVWNSGILECWVDEAESQLDFLLFLLGERILSSGKYDL